MSNIIENKSANIVEIKAPELTSTEYAQGLEQVFDNINNNFQTLSNHEFIKGETGNSVYVRPVSLYENDKYTEIGEQIRSTIYNGEEPLPYITINNVVFNWDDNLKSSSINMLVSIDNHSTNTTEQYVSSLYFVFLDGRFVNTHPEFKLGDIAAENYEGIDDLSCIIVYENGKFTKLENAFPTIAYEKGNGLCWKLNGNNTGMPIQGIPGNNGKNAQISIVKASGELQEGNFAKLTVTNIFEPISGMISVSELETIDEYNEVSALVLYESENKIEYYFGTLLIEDNTLKANVFTGKNIISNATLEGFNNAMKSINLSSDGDSASVLRGLFIPLTNGTNGTPAHLLSAASITGEQNSTVTDPYKNDVIFSPINDYDSITEEKNISVNKYLYVRTNYIYIDSIKIAYGIDVNSNNPTAKYNGILKYKLDSIVTKDSTDFNLPERTDVISDVNMLNTVTNLPYNNENQKLYTSFPYNVQNKLNTGLYKWVLCTDKHNFDIDELRSETNTVLDFPKYFNNIYTTELTPTAASVIYWFDSYGYDETTINNISYKLVDGFYGSENKISFVKFVPIHKNDLPINADTTLNLNYNVNITGDNNLYNKSLTVHGGINCDDLSVYKLTAAGEIKNIYTKDTIIGDSGINLMKNDNGTYNFYVEPDGDVIARKTVRTNCINLTGLIDDSGSISSIESDQANSVITKNLIATNIADIKNVTLAKNSDDDSYIEVKLNDNKTEVLGKGINDIELNGNNESIVTTNIPININANGTLIVSNQPKNSERLYSKGINPGYDGIKDYSFESTRNFNLQDFYESNYSDESSVNISYNVKTYDSTTRMSLVVDDDNRFSPMCSAGDIDWVNSVTATNPNITSTYILNNYCQKITLNQTLNDTCLLPDEQNKSLTWLFNKTMQMHIGVFGRKHTYGEWPILMNDSYIKFSIFYIDNSNNVTHIIDAPETYTFDYTVTDAKNCTQDTNPWKGFSYSGASIENEKETGWRYYAYRVKPLNIKISGSHVSTLLNKIKENKGSGTLYLVPKCRITVKTQKERNNYCLKRIYATAPRPISDTTLSSGTTLKRVTTGVHVNFGGMQPGGKMVIKYKNLSVSTGEVANEDVKVTTVCDDGIIMRAGKYLFGLGYANAVNHNRAGGAGEPDFGSIGYSSQKVGDKNVLWNAPAAAGSEQSISGNVGPQYFTHIPVLFYYDASVVKNYSDIDEDLLTTNTNGYAKRVDSIPLKDIFECIRYLREDKHYKFGI